MLPRHLLNNLMATDFGIDRRWPPFNLHSRVYHSPPGADPSNAIPNAGLHT